MLSVFVGYLLVYLLFIRRLCQLHRKVCWGLPLQALDGNSALLWVCLTNLCLWICSRLSPVLTKNWSVASCHHCVTDFSLAFAWLMHALPSAICDNIILICFELIDCIAWLMFDWSICHLWHQEGCPISAWEWQWTAIGLFGNLHWVLLLTRSTYPPYGREFSNIKPYAVH